MNEIFYLEKPNIKRKNDVIEYLNEHIKFNSDIHGAGSFDKILEGYTYEDMLERNEKMKNRNFALSINRSPSTTLFLIRKNDNKLIGMINIRTELTDEIKEFGGNIGYSIRPSERRKGYNKINIYLGLLKLKELGINDITISCTYDNIASNKSIISLGGNLIKQDTDPYDNKLTNVYHINVNKSIIEHKNEYNNKIIKKQI